MGERPCTLEGLAVSRLPDAQFWRGKRVLLTGHTGFKGGWAALWLAELGSQVTGFALPPEPGPSLFDSACIGAVCQSRFGDLRDLDAIRAAVEAADPEIVLHLAAQPLVRRAILEPVATLATNVMGTAHLLESLRDRSSLERILVVTSDKVYDNREEGHAFSEEDRLGGKDPYSASKAAAEIVTRAYAETYFNHAGVSVVTARGGNVIGGGDHAADRIVPDVMRAAAQGLRPVLRMPQATRPWQHVLDCLAGYLLFAEDAYLPVPRALNFGPDPQTPVTVGELTRVLLAAIGREPVFDHVPSLGSVEMKTLAVDARRAAEALGWRNRLPGEAAIHWTADWYGRVARGDDARAVTRGQIEDYCERVG